MKASFSSTGSSLQLTFLVLVALFAAPLATRADWWEALAPVPGPRAAHSAVWTGREMIVWGGGVDGEFLNSGARYLPTINTWRETSLNDAPSPRWFHAAVWTGYEMLIWGGRPNFAGENNLNDGARYNPVTDTWTPMSQESAPIPRSQCAAVWTGSEMIIWGGETENGVPLADGASYNPETDRWRPISSSGLAPRMEPTAIWTGREMIVFGGVDVTQPGWLSFGDGARYNPATDGWTPIPAEAAPSPRTGHTAVWTGERMIVWGGREMPSQNSLDTGSSFDPGANRWTPLPVSQASGARMYHAAVWSGTEMIVWGELIDLSTIVNSGARYQPAAQTWTATTPTDAPGQRHFWRPDLGIWTGRGMLISAGSDYPASLDSTFLYHLDGTNATPSETNCIPTPSGMVAWWQGEGNAEDAAGMHHGTFVGNVTFAPGKVGQGFYFDGSGGYVRIPNDNALDFSNELTIELWYKHEGLADEAYGLVSARGTEEGGVNYAISVIPIGIGPYFNDPTVATGDDADAGGSFEASRYQPVPARGRFHHLGVTYRQASPTEVELKTFIDGALVRTKRLPAQLANTVSDAAIVIGRSAEYGEEWFTGVIDEVAIYRRALTDAEMVSIAASGRAGKCGAPGVDTVCRPPPPGLVGWWPGERDAQDRVDGHHGVGQGGATFQTGAVGQGFAFHGSTSNVRIAASPSLDVGAGQGMTIELWINPDDVTQSGPLVEWNNGVDLFGAHFWILPNQSGDGLQPPSTAVAGPGQLYAAFTLLGQWYQMITDANVLRSHVFQHVALTYDKATGVGRIYRDGVPVAEQTLGTLTPQTSYDLYLGLRPAGPAGDPVQAYQGLMDEVSLYNRALTGDEIAAIFRAGASGKCKTPEGWEQLVTMVGELPPPVNQEPLLASLTASRVSMQRANVQAAIQQLRAFQILVEAQVNPQAPALAADLSAAALQIIESLDPGGARRAELDAMAGQRPRMQRAFPVTQSGVEIQASALPGTPCSVQRSTNLRDWMDVGVPVEMSDGVFLLTDPPPTGPTVFYRLKSP